MEGDGLGEENCGDYVCTRQLRRLPVGLLRLHIDVYRLSPRGRRKYTVAVYGV